MEEERTSSIGMMGEGERDCDGREPRERNDDTKGRMMGNRVEKSLGKRARYMNE